MKLIKLLKVSVPLPLLILIPFLGISLLSVASANPGSDKQRFEEVADQLDLGGVLYGYVSVDGDLSGLAKFVNSFMSGMKEIDKGVSAHIPDVDIEALMQISGLDSISALGLSSIQLEEGFRNKVYLHAPNGVRGFLSMFGDEAKPFEVLQLAPSGADIVIQQDIKLKTFYNEVVMGVLGGSPEQGGKMPLGPQGMMMKMMVDGMMKQPLPPPLTFTGEKIIKDLDTNIMVIIDADPSKMIRVENKDLAMPQIHGAILVDNLGWLAGNLIKLLAAEMAEGGKGVPPFEVIDNANWIGLKLSIESEAFSKRDRKEIKQFGLQNAMIAHHRPSGKLIATTSKEFAAGLFSKKPKLASDPVFLAKTKGLPKQGTAISYLSPVLMTELRKFIKEAIEVENPPEKEHKRDDRFAALSMLDFFLPEGALGEAMVTTVTEDGLLSVGNSAYSHKSKILMGAAVPTLVGVSMFTAVRQLDFLHASEKTKKELYMEALEPAKAFEDLEIPKTVPHNHEHKNIPEKPWDPDGKSADMSRPVQVFIIMGQSNTLEMGKVKGDKEGSLEYAVKKEKFYPFMVDEAGVWTSRKDVRYVHTQGSGGPDGRGGVRRNDWLTVSSSKIGIEQGIGHQLGNAYDEPILILKSSIGNRSLGWDLLPPGSPRHEVETTDKKTGKKVTLVTPAHNDEVRHPSWTKGDTPEPPSHTWHAGLQYLGDVARAKKVLSELDKHYPGATKYEVAGFLWWQGDKDRYNEAHSTVYGKNLKQLFKELRKEFNAPKAKMVVATLGQTKKETATGNEKLILDGMFAFGDSHKGEVAVVYTNPISMGSSSNAHYGGNAKTYMNVGLLMGNAMVALLKK